MKIIIIKIQHSSDLKNNNKIILNIFKVFFKVGILIFSILFYFISEYFKYFLFNKTNKRQAREIGFFTQRVTF